MAAATTPTHRSLTRACGGLNRFADDHGIECHVPCMPGVALARPSARNKGWPVIEPLVGLVTRPEGRGGRRP